MFPSLTRRSKGRFAPVRFLNYLQAEALCYFLSSSTGKTPLSFALGIYTMSQKGHITGMAGEFHVMELLFRLEHEPSLTLGNAKSIDILTRSPKGNLYEVSVKAMRGGGKWGIGNEDYSKAKNLIFVLLYYKRFDQLSELPDIWIIPATHAEKIKLQWHSQFGLYLYKEHVHLLAPYKDAWNYLA